MVGWRFQTLDVCTYMPNRVNDCEEEEYPVSQLSAFFSGLGMNES